MLPFNISIRFNYGPEMMTVHLQSPGPQLHLTDMCLQVCEHHLWGQNITCGGRTSPVGADLYLVNTLWVFEEHKAEAPGAACHGVQLQRAVYDLSVLGEVILQVLLGRVPAETSYKHLPVDTGRENTTLVGRLTTQL